MLHTDPVPTRNLLVTDWLSLLPAKIQNTWFWDMCWFTKTAAFSFCPIIQVNLWFSDKIMFPKKKSIKKTIVHKHTSTLAWSSKIQIQHPPPPPQYKVNKINKESIKICFLPCKFSGFMHLNSLFHYYISFTAYTCTFVIIFKQVFKNFRSEF